MTDRSLPRAPRPPTGPRRAVAFRNFIIGISLYAVIVVLEGVLVDADDLSAWVGIALAVAPMAAAVWAMVNWLEGVRTFDEFQQKIFTESGLIALGITAVASFTYGFLESYVGLPKLSMFVVFPFMALCYSISLPLVHRRYR